MDALHRPTTADIEDTLVLRVYADAGTNAAAFAYLVEHCDIPPKIVESKIQSLTKRSLMDWGVSVRYAWVTPRGLAVLKEAGL
jgi:hypothetical protein